MGNSDYPYRVVALSGWHQSVLYMEQREWLDAHAGPQGWKVKTANVKTQRRQFLFKDADIAAMFKLTWGGK